MRVAVGQYVADADRSAIPITPDIAEAIRHRGFNPADFNVMRWPMGASRYGSCRILVHSDDVAALTNVSGFDIVMGEIEFVGMVGLNPEPILISEGTGTVYAIEGVDAREYWKRPAQFNQTPDGINVSTDDKEALYETTLNDGAPWTPHDLLVELFATLPSTIDIPDTPETQDPDDLRDITSAGQSYGELIDQICAACGHVLLAYPNTTYGGGGVLYRVVPIASGEAAALSEFVRLEDDLVAGGLRSPSSELGSPPTDLLTAAIGTPEWAVSDVPYAVRVHFPKAAQAGAEYRFNEPDQTIVDPPGLDYVTDRYAVAISSQGRPIDPALARDVAVFDNKWAIADAVDDVQNQPDLFARADVVAARYYSRFFAGTGDAIFRGFVDVVPWSGVGEIIWDAMPEGSLPMTRVRGHFEDPRFGFNLDPLGGLLMSTGIVRAFPRSDGRTLLDGPVQTAGVGLHYGEITAVVPAPPPVGPTYDAAAYYSQVTVTGATPIRAHDITDPGVPLEVNARQVGDPCILGVRPDGTVDLWLIETARLAACASAQATAFSRNDAIAELRAAAAARR